MLHLIRLFSFVVLSRVCHAQCSLTPYAHTVLTWLWRWLPHRLIVKTSITVNNSPIQEVLSSLGRSYSTCLWIDSWVQTFHSVCVLFISQENHTGCVLKHVKNQEIQKHTFWTFELIVVETILPLIKIIDYTVHGVQKNVLISSDHLSWFSQKTPCNHSEALYFFSLRQCYGSK